MSGRRGRFGNGRDAAGGGNSAREAAAGGTNAGGTSSHPAPSSAQAKAPGRGNGRPGAVKGKSAEKISLDCDVTQWSVEEVCVWLSTAMEGESLPDDQLKAYQHAPSSAQAKALGRGNGRPGAVKGKSAEKISLDCDVTQWSVEEVCVWLSTAMEGESLPDDQLKAYQHAFSTHSINGNHLLSLTHEHLSKDLGITSLGHRLTLLHQRDMLPGHVHPESLKGSIDDLSHHTIAAEVASVDAFRLLEILSKSTADYHKTLLGAVRALGEKIDKLASAKATSDRAEGTKKKGAEANQEAANKAKTPAGAGKDGAKEGGNAREKASEHKVADHAGESAKTETSGKSKEGGKGEGGKAKVKSTPPKEEGDAKTEGSAKAKPNKEKEGNVNSETPAKSEAAKVAAAAVEVSVAPSSPKVVAPVGGRSAGPDESVRQWSAHWLKGMQLAESVSVKDGLATLKL